MASGAVVDTIMHVVGQFRRRDPPSVPGLGNVLVDFPAFRRLIESCCRSWKETKNTRVGFVDLYLGREIAGLDLIVDADVKRFIELFFRTILRNNGIADMDEDDVVFCLEGYLQFYRYEYQTCKEPRRGEGDARATRSRLGPWLRPRVSNHARDSRAVNLRDERR